MGKSGNGGITTPYELSRVGSGLGANAISKIAISVVEIDLLKRDFWVHRPSVPISFYDLLIRGRSDSKKYYRVKVKKVNITNGLYSYHDPPSRKFDILALCAMPNSVGYHDIVALPNLSTRDFINDYFLSSVLHPK